MSLSLITQRQLFWQKDSGVKPIQALLLFLAPLNTKSVTILYIVPMIPFSGDEQPFLSFYIKGAGGGIGGGVVS
jgi:hypothetical protein